MIVKTLEIKRAGQLPADRAVMARVQRLRTLVHDTGQQAHARTAGAEAATAPAPS